MFQFPGANFVDPVLTGFPSPTPRLDAYVPSHHRCHTWPRLLGKEDCLSHPPHRSPHGPPPSLPRTSLSQKIEARTLELGASQPLIETTGRQLICRVHPLSPRTHTLSRTDTPLRSHLSRGPSLRLVALFSFSSAGPYEFEQPGGTAGFGKPTVYD